MESELIDKLLSNYDWAGVGADTRHGKIYYIDNNKTNTVYVGSTCDPLDKCFLDHVYYYRSWLKLSKYKKRKYRGLSSYKVLRDGFATIHLIEEYPCDHITELKVREGEIRRKYPNAVNKRIAGRTGKQWKAEKKQEKEQEEINAVKDKLVPKPVEYSADIHDIMKDLKAFDF